MAAYRQKLHSARGVSLAIVVLALAVLALLAAIAAPWVRDYRGRAERIGCDAAVDSAYRALTADFLLNMEKMSPREARAALAAAMPGREGICPSGGDVYLIPRENGTYDLVCGLHGHDPKQRTTLNGENVREQVEEALARCARVGEELPASIETTVNGKTLTVERVEAEPDIHRGTKTTPGYEGIVAFFMADEKAGLTYFCYADETNCVIDRWAGEGAK